MLNNLHIRLRIVYRIVAPTLRMVYRIVAPSTPRILVYRIVAPTPVALTPRMVLGRHPHPHQLQLQHQLRWRFVLVRQR